MRTWNLLLASLLVALYGCQPETPTQQSAAPAVEPAVEPAPVEAPAAMMSAPEPALIQPAAPPAKAPAAQEKPAAKEPVSAAPTAKPVPTPAAAAAPATTVAAAPVAAAASPAPAPAKAVLSEADALALAKKSGCLVCHAIDKRVVGPAWRDVAAKYRGDAGAEARMMDKIAKGGKGVWGSTAMPPNPKLSEADRQALARFVLSLK